MSKRGALGQRCLKIRQHLQKLGFELYYSNESATMLSPVECYRRDMGRVRLIVRLHHHGRHVTYFRIQKGDLYQTVHGCSQRFGSSAELLTALDRCQAMAVGAILANLEVFDDP